jgi:hypothetical protein
MMMDKCIGRIRHGPLACVLVLQAATRGSFCHWQLWDSESLCTERDPVCADRAQSLSRSGIIRHPVWPRSQPPMSAVTRVMGRWHSRMHWP